ncbi:protein ALP1-like isoform X2 [Melanaphis sacchari]|nr:protein ALP1-like isoform X2 [Melanaphis sacchari]XP_025194757.1 protein ALP1-like isoform X2 [Melanaphis sacchari]XP_025194758.1 protein ALP1-like isoform X2 [Melanaphis sacchari]
MNRKKIKVVAVAEALGLLDPPKVQRRYWVHPLNMDREKIGQFRTFFENIRQYPDKFFEYYRMSISSFDELLKTLRPHITKSTTEFRNPISAEERLTITIRYLSTGTCFSALKFDFCVGRSTIGVIVKDTCKVIWLTLNSKEMPKPTTEDWVEISNIFYTKTNFSNCLGAIDGKHIRCKNPNDSGSLYFNYKKYFSIVFMAVVDANLNFVVIDVGSYGREGDSNVFKECAFGKQLYEDKLNIPEPVVLPNTSANPQPYVFIGDEAFALHKNLLRPYPGRKLTDSRRVFNYRLSRARRTVECAFGVLANKWRVLHTAIQVEPDFTDDIIKACCILHNFVRKRDGINYEDSQTHNFEDIEARGTGTRSDGVEVRDYFANYFMGPGAVDFQYDMI